MNRIYITVAQDGSVQPFRNLHSAIEQSGKNAGGAFFKAWMGVAEYEAWVQDIEQSVHKDGYWRYHHANSESQDIMCAIVALDVEDEGDDYDLAEVALNMHLDEIDLEAIDAAYVKRMSCKTPLVGDYIIYEGDYWRITMSNLDGWQIATGPGNVGSFHLNRSGMASYSGGLQPTLEKERIEPTDQFRDGGFWTFHHQSARAHNGVNFTLKVRVFEYS